MMQFESRVPLILMGVSILAIPQTHASLVTVSFSGEITQLIDNADLWAGAVNVGASFSGTYVYNDTTVDTLVDPSQGRYSYQSFVLDFDGLHLDSTTVVGNGDKLISVNDDVSGVDNYVVGFANSGPAREFIFGGLTYNQGFFSLGWTDLSTLTSDALVPPPALPADSFNIIRLGATDGVNNAIVVGAIAFISLVPEPSTLALLTVSIAALLCRTRVT